MDARNHEELLLEAWPEVIGQLEGREWSHGAVLMDLAWWQAQIIRQRRPVKLLPRRRLADRWGWSERRVRAVLAQLNESDENSVWVIRFGGR